MVLLLLALSVVGWKYYRWDKENPYAVWETMVVLRSQTLSEDPAEDAKGALKRGDVIALRDAGHQWSDTEYKSYLLVKIKGRRSEVIKLLEPEYEDVENAENAEEALGREIVKARKYAVDIVKIGFKGDQVIKGQPVENEIYGTDIIIEKK